MTQSHELPIRVYYEDTDAGGIVYHASYLRYAERGRTEMLRASGYEHVKLANDTGIAFAVVNMTINYKAPARLDDLLTLKTRISKLGGASMDMQQYVYKGDTLLTEIRVTLVCVDRGMKAVRLPQALRDLFEK